MEQSEADKIKSEVLTAAMQVMKIITITLALESKADKGRMASVFSAATLDEDLDPVAREVLSELAISLTMMARGVRPPG